jgi:hypothetical protein
MMGDYSQPGTYTQALGIGNSYMDPNQTNMQQPMYQQMGPMMNMQPMYANPGMTMGQMGGPGMVAWDNMGMPLNNGMQGQLGVPMGGMQGQMGMPMGGMQGQMTPMQGQMHVGQMAPMPGQMAPMQMQMQGHMTMPGQIQGQMAHMHGMGMEQQRLSEPMVQSAVGVNIADGLSIANSIEMDSNRENNLPALANTGVDEAQLQSFLDEDETRGAALDEAPDVPDLGDDGGAGGDLALTATNDLQDIELDGDRETIEVI